MHELSLATSIVEIADREAERRGLSGLKAVVVQVGCLTDVSPEALEFAFEYAREGTLAAGAALAIQRVAGIGTCRQCGERLEAYSLYFACAECGSRDVAFESGDELRVVGLEIEDPAEDAPEARECGLS